MVGTVAIEHADGVVNDAVFVTFFAFHGEEATGGHDTEVTAEGTDTTDIFIANQLLDSLAVVEDLEVDGIDGAFKREGGLELTDLDGKLPAGFVLDESVDQHGAAAEVALDLVAHRLREVAVHR